MVEVIVGNSGDKKNFAGAAKDFVNAASISDPRITELVRHLARVSADKDYKEVTDSRKVRYSSPAKKGLKND